MGVYGQNPGFVLQESPSRQTTSVPKTISSGHMVALVPWLGTGIIVGGEGSSSSAQWREKSHSLNVSARSLLVASDRNSNHTCLTCF